MTKQTFKQQKSRQKHQSNNETFKTKSEESFQKKKLQKKITYNTAGKKIYLSKTYLEESEDSLRDRRPLRTRERLRPLLLGFGDFDLEKDNT